VGVLGVVSFFFFFDRTGKEVRPRDLSHQMDSG
jgi:hypothetical protein